MTRYLETAVGLGTSAESWEASVDLAEHLNGQIVALAREAGTKGLTINEAERRIPGHKGHSISPRFAVLVRRGVLVREEIGRTEPTDRFPEGAPRFKTRFDEQTRRHVILHWLPEFAPKPETNRRPSARATAQPGTVEKKRRA